MVLTETRLAAGRFDIAFSPSHTKSMHRTWYGSIYRYNCRCSNGKQWKQSDMSLSDGLLLVSAERMFNVIVVVYHQQLKSRQSHEFSNSMWPQRVSDVIGSAVVDTVRWICAADAQSAYVTTSRVTSPQTQRKSITNGASPDHRHCT